MTLTDDDRTWRDTHFPGMSDEDLKKIVDTFGDDGQAIATKEKEPIKRKIAIKKYTAKGTIPLHETVVINKVPKFVYLDKDKKPHFVDKIERTNDILIPGDTFDTQNPIPFIFESEEKFEECLEQAHKETLDSLFQKVETLNRKYVDTEGHYHTLLTADMIWTWMQDRFGYTHYNIIRGDNGSGKNSQLLVFKFLGYRVFYVVSATAPNYFTKMGNVEEGQITIAEDEADDIARDKEKRNVINVYSHKWFAMEELPTIREIKGIIDRSFVLTFVAGNPQYNIKDVLNSAGDPKFKPLYDELIDTRNILFCWRLLHYEDILADVELNVKNRSAELTKPLIRLFQNSTVALGKILYSLSEFMTERNEVKASSFESMLYKVVENLINKNKDTTLKNADIKSDSKEVMDGEDSLDKPGAFWSPIEGISTVTQTRITSTCKSRFKAKPKFIKLEDKTYRALVFDKKVLERIKSNYEVVDEIKIVKPVTLVTPVTVCSNEQPTETDNPNGNIIKPVVDSSINIDKKCENSIETRADTGGKEGNTLPEGVTSVESVTHGNSTTVLVEKKQLAEKASRDKEPEIRQSVPSEYHTKAPIIWNGDVSQLIQIKGTEIGDQVIFDAYPAVGNFTLKNNFLTGHLRMRGREGGQYPHNYLEFINRVFDATTPDRTIEVCSNRIPGLNKCGNCFTVDTNPEFKPDLIVDGQTLEGIKDNYFERWRCDPPYNDKTAKEMYETELPSLFKLLEAGARIIKPGSLMFLLCSQNVQSGTIDKGNIKRIGFIYISVVPNNETRILNIYVKLPEEKQDGPKIAH